MFVEMSPGCVSFDQGDGCPDLGTRCFSASVTCCNYTRLIFGCFGFLVYVIYFIVLRVDRLGRTVMGASLTETEAVLDSGFLPRKVVASLRLFSSRLFSEFPFGDDRFVAELESRAGRLLRCKPPGPQPKSRVATA